jgi:predicted RNA binding protein YcfA (HicA-like mRNA interferase family)
VKIPRDLSGADLARSLRFLGYERIRQDGSHLRLTTEVGGQHHVTIPNHSALKVGTLSAILKEVARHHELTVEALLEKIGI